MTDDDKVQLVIGADPHDLFGADELDPELLGWIITHDDGHVSIKHPLVFSIYHHPMLNRMVNRGLAAKQECLVRYTEEQNWHGFIDAHERPYRVDALLEIEDVVTDAQWWELVAHVWIDSENIRELPDVWDSILRADRLGRHAMMHDYERKAFDELPAVIDVYQGCTDQRDDGWSFTTKRETAVWFADRFALLEKAKPRLRTGQVAKTNVTAYLTRRNESEILVAPEFVIES